ncbi:MAG: hypothetical protein M0P64_03330 [Candidatus Pacebacteria bacterium]|jgi:hypothetical protein|nr:hypothetical protein [Candidatus Paceibacterota bacterium]
MNIIIFQAFRATVVLGIAIFAFASDALAAPVLTPATATRVTENSATIIGHVSNPQKNSTVWFELFNKSGAVTAVAVQGIWNDGTFEWNLRDLNQGETYSFRSAAMEGGVTVYSPTSSFTTVVPKVAVPVTTTTSPSGVSTPTSATKTTKAVETTTVEKKATATPVVTSEGFTNNNSAAIIGAGSGLFPTTLIGWIILIIAILAVVLLGQMVNESIEKRKKIAEEKKKEEAGEDIE